MLRSLASRTFARAKSTATRPASESAAHEASTASSTASSSSAPAASARPTEQKKPDLETRAREQAKATGVDPALAYKQLLEERFGGGDSAALGTLVNGQPEGLAPNVKRNMFRLI
ncbi:hypothetical protein Rhopal_005742-T1 [Rhodotorula paludigena]|uniref:Uncharacterized protein n=1 Tax=Rhodotorula paludigena TaxID=86838 RepID=A0AAV5GUI8_9BASI|nr:hypothetical protein Rhopal_005742-T1 [Rhodotorula paludigena]